MTKKGSRTKDRRKPTGSVGHISVDADSASFVTVRFPDSKADIERYILDRAIATAKSEQRNLYSLLEPPTQNSESDFDFTLRTRKGIAFLDLMEFAPLFGGGYLTAPTSFRPWEYAERLFRQLLRKSNKYGIAQRAPVHLLTYVTDWRFHSPEVLGLVALWLGRERHCFATIFHYVPFEQYDGELTELYPLAVQYLSESDARGLRHGVIMLADFPKLQSDDSGAITVPLGPPPPGSIIGRSRR